MTTVEMDNETSFSNYISSILIKNWFFKILNYRISERNKRMYFAPDFCLLDQRLPSSEMIHMYLCMYVQPKVPNKIRSFGIHRIHNMVFAYVLFMYCCLPRWAATVIAINGTIAMERFYTVQWNILSKEFQMLWSKASECAWQFC